MVSFAFQDLHFHLMCSVFGDIPDVGYIHFGPLYKAVVSVGSNHEDMMGRVVKHRKRLLDDQTVRK